MKFHGSLRVMGVLLVTLPAWSQEAGVPSDKHDLNGQSCAACHVTQLATPPEKRQQDPCDQGLLWDCKLLTRAFQTYDAALPTGKETAPVLDETQARMSSLLCASCHDGVSTPTMSGTAGFAGNASNAAKGLRNEHPIDVPHDPGKDPSLAALAVVNKQVKLFGDTNRVQCASCHNVHDSSDPKLLRMMNKNSALCLTCHL